MLAAVQAIVTVVLTELVLSAGVASFSALKIETLFVRTLPLVAAALTSA